jgi:type I restriction enzyme S subunit
MAPEETCSFVPMEAIDQTEARITHLADRRVSEVARGYTPFAENDVLLAKITPCMENGKCAIARSLHNGIGFGSTEFHVLRPKDRVTAEWLFYFWRLPETRRWAARQMTGSAGQKRVSASYLENLQIPLPDVGEQRRVTGVLDRLDRLRRMRRYALELSDTFLPAAFLEMFGDPLDQSKRWVANEFGAVGSLDRGRSKHRPRNAPHLYGGPYPFIQTGDVANCRGYLRTHTQTYSEAGLAQSKLWPAGTLCITIAANIADTGILTYPACFPDSVVGFTPSDRVFVEYIQYWLRFTQQQLERTAPEVAQKNINLQILRELRCPLPPLDLQQRFSTLVQGQERLRQKHREALRQADLLFQSLLNRAFTNGLP